MSSKILTWGKRDRKYRGEILWEVRPIRDCTDNDRCSCYNTDECAMDCNCASVMGYMCAPSFNALLEPIEGSPGTFRYITGRKPVSIERDQTGIWRAIDSPDRREWRLCQQFHDCGNGAWVAFEEDTLGVIPPKDFVLPEVLGSYAISATQVG